MLLKQVLPNELSNFIQVGQTLSPCILYGQMDKSFVWICDKDLCDYDYVLDHNIAHMLLPATGSVIVASPKDLYIGIFGTEEYCDAMFSKLALFISKKLNGGVLLNNDFMYEGYKYGAAARIATEQGYCVGVVISNAINLDLINKISKKQSYKTPNKMPIEITLEDIKMLFKED